MMVNYLVGGWPTPPKNDGLRQLGWWHSQYDGKVIKAMFHTTNQLVSQRHNTSQYVTTIHNHISSNNHILLNHLSWLFMLVESENCGISKDHQKTSPACPQYERYEMLWTSWISNGNGTMEKFFHYAPLMGCSGPWHPDPSDHVGGTPTPQMLWLNTKKIDKYDKSLI